MKGAAPARVEAKLVRVAREMVVRVRPLRLGVERRLPRRVRLQPRVEPKHLRRVRLVQKEGQDVSS